MAMDPRFDDFSFSIDDFDFESHISLPDPNQSLKFANGFETIEPALEFDPFVVGSLLSTGSDSFNGMPAISIDDLDGELVFQAEPGGGSMGRTLDAGVESPSSSDDSSASDPVLKYINQMLMEENMEEKVWISSDDFALRDTERSLYDVLGEQYPGLPDQYQGFDASQFIGSPTSNLSGSSNGRSSTGTIVASTISSNSTDANGLHDHGDYKRAITSANHPLDYSSPFSASSSIHDANGLVDSSVLNNFYNDDESIMQFKRGLEEASKFLPPSINFQNASSDFADLSGILEVGGHGDKGAKSDTLSGSRGRKNHEREDLGLEEGRAAKQTAAYAEMEEAELSDLLDKVLLGICKVEPFSSTGSCLPTEASKDSQTRAPLRRPNGGKGRGRRQGNGSSVDLRGLLILCAQAVSSNDLRTAKELLKQIRENSSPSGDGSQRLAHYFANGLEARMAGDRGGTQSFHASVVSKRRSVADILKAYHLHLSSCPFKRLSILYMNCTILQLSHKASVLHIIDFGIAFGFQWPVLIQKLGEQDGGPPKLRITGIDFPQTGFRPAERIEETGRRLARYCKRFNVPFEFNAVASSNWETIKIEDLKIGSGEMIAVNCLMRFKNLLDETVEEDNPRDAVLDLIRRIKPDVFVHAVGNGTYNAPFFVTRFREALFHLSSIYDMLDATIPDGYKNSSERIVLESEFYGREVMNVIACEGPERVERPETYRQWQARHEKAGFKQLPLDQTMKKFRHKLEAWYHKDFVLDEDGNWMLLGWKGRIMYATTCWIPV